MDPASIVGLVCSVVSIVDHNHHIPLLVPVLISLNCRRRPESNTISEMWMQRIRDSKTQLLNSVSYPLANTISPNYRRRSDSNATSKTLLGMYDGPVYWVRYCIREDLYICAFLKGSSGFYINMLNILIIKNILVIRKILVIGLYFCVAYAVFDSSIISFI